ncbi:type II toxin-antitoxin system RatA family toxin [Sphingobium phenoxybenzoativorans]|uniref:Type II toxin-antitoxin system RatA family toxin n=1 Tax=Sphingobium phenoxybenzoativorans TaxID=1592790 RepID=A0A975K4C8_9SPHN|nr:type II toxin-antitoxin system RatA family toxin [Sphingobium phenoxybenzoativorans]QUT03888.1 type II toxin-antitoxin system RatA family toxin [Sphingobium phenoxybenzoativorans]
MPTHKETRRLPYTPEQMFDLVADVQRYEDFLPWVSAIRVRSDSETEMVADMIVGFKGLRETVTSKVNKRRPEEIHVDYVDGPLKHLHNHWRFRPDDGDGVLVDFEVAFEFKNKLFEMIAGQMFDSALRKMIGAFEARAVALYGTGESGSSKSSATNAA